MRRLLLLLLIVTPFSVASAQTPASDKPADTKRLAALHRQDGAARQGAIAAAGLDRTDHHRHQGGAPAESPQGQTPPGMQAAPEGSSKTISGPK